MLLSSGSGLDEDGAGRLGLASDHVGRCGDGGRKSTVPMRSSADGDSVLEERLTVLEHSLGTMERAQGPIAEPEGGQANARS